MTSHDTEYYRARAEEERKAAAEASQSEVRLIHLQLARQYEDLARQPRQQPQPQAQPQQRMAMKVA